MKTPPFFGGFFMDFGKKSVWKDREARPRHAALAAADAKRTHQEAHDLRRSNRRAQEKASKSFEDPLGAKYKEI